MTELSQGAKGEKEEIPFGLKVIIAYKFIKGPLSLSLALLLTFAPDRSFGFARHLLAQLSEWGPLMARASHWLERQLTHGLVGKAMILVWLDGTSTIIEGILLATGKWWAEWVVVVVLSGLIPFELMHFFRHPSWGRASVVLINVLVVAYLVWLRLRTHKKEQQARAARLTLQTRVHEAERAESSAQR